MAKLGQSVVFTDRGGGAPRAAMVVQEGSDGEGAGYTILMVFGPDGSISTVEAVPAGADVGNSSGTFAES